MDASSSHTDLAPENLSRTTTPATSIEYPLTQHRAHLLSSPTRLSSYRQIRTPTRAAGLPRREIVGDGFNAQERRIRSILPLGPLRNFKAVRYPPTKVVSAAEAELSQLQCKIVTTDDAALNEPIQSFERGSDSCNHAEVAKPTPAQPEIHLKGQQQQEASLSNAHAPDGLTQRGLGKSTLPLLRPPEPDQTLSLHGSDRNASNNAHMDEPDVADDEILSIGDAEPAKPLTASWASMRSGDTCSSEHMENRSLIEASTVSGVTDDGADDERTSTFRAYGSGPTGGACNKYRHLAQHATHVSYDLDEILLRKQAKPGQSQAAKYRASRLAASDLQEVPGILTGLASWPPQHPSVGASSVLSRQHSFAWDTDQPRMSLNPPFRR